MNEAAVSEHVRAGMYYAAFDHEGPVGVFRFQLQDRHFWPEVQDGLSAFVHKIAVYSYKQGRDVSHALLRHARELTRQHGRHFSGWIALLEDPSCGLFMSDSGSGTTV